MPLNWIVPARRTVVCGPSGASTVVPYREVLDAWVTQLTEHRETLQNWYVPNRSPEEQQRVFDAGRSALETWKETFLASDGQEERRITVPYQGAHAVTLRHMQTISAPSPRFPVRLWKGPYRVLNERSTRQPDGCHETIIVGIEGTELVLNPLHEVANPGASFLPGDVIEFPLFRFWAVAGLGQYCNAVFNPQGSFFLGTSVGEIVGQAAEEQDSPEETESETEVSDEDHEALDPGIDEESPAEAEDAAAAHAEVTCEGWRILAPGQVQLHDNMLAMRFQLLLNAAIGAYYKSSPVFSAGATRRANEQHTRRFNDRSVHARGIVYGGILGCVNRSPAPNLFVLACNNWGTINLPSSLSMLAGSGSDPLTCAWSCSPCALALGYYLVNTPSTFGRGGGGQIHSEIQREASPLRPYATFTQFLPVEVNEDDALRAQRDAALRAMIGEEGCDLADALPDLRPEQAQPREVSVEQMRSFLGEGWATISLAGHEYSIVRVWPHHKILNDRAMGAPPVAGWIAAYNPLDGNSYNSDNDDGRLFIFEAGGSLARTLWLPPPYACSVFGISPFYWREIECLQMGRMGRIQNISRNTFYLGEGDRVRGRYIVGITRYDNDAVRTVHDVSQAYRPISFYTNPPLIQEPINVYYPDRAVPFPTMDESAGHHVVSADGDQVYIYTRIRTARSNRNQMNARLRSLVSGSNLSREGVRQVCLALGERNFRSYVQEAQSRLDSQVEFLRQRLRSRGGPVELSPAARAEIRVMDQETNRWRQIYRRNHGIWLRLHRGSATPQDRATLDSAVPEEGLRPRQRIRRFREGYVVPAQNVCPTFQQRRTQLLRQAGGPGLSDRLELERRLEEATRRQEQFRGLSPEQQECIAFPNVVERIGSVRELLGIP